LIRQVVGNPAPQGFGIAQLIASARVNAPSYRFLWRKHQPEEKSGDQSAQMRGHADLWSRKIECDLDRDNQADVCEPLPGQRGMMVSQQKSRPRAYYSHDASRSAYDLSDLNQSNYSQS